MRKAVILENEKGLFDVCLLLFGNELDEPLRSFETIWEAISFIENNGFEYRN